MLNLLPSLPLLYIKPESKYYYIGIIVLGLILARIAYLFIVKVNIIKYNKEKNDKK